MIELTNGSEKMDVTSASFSDLRGFSETECKIWKLYDAGLSGGSQS